MSFVYHNLAPLCVALMLSTISWVYGGARGELLMPVIPWLFLILLEVAVCFPQRRGNETTYGARVRVWAEMKRDPIVWTSLGLLVLLTIPFVNSGLCPTCDMQLIAQGAVPDPPVKFLPFCVNRLHHYSVFLWFAASLLAMVATRHSLSRHGKRFLLETLVWNGVALALLGFVQNAVGAPGPLWDGDCGLQSGATSEFFSTFGYPNMAGDYFTTLFAISVALWRRRHAEVAEAIAASHTGRDEVHRRGVFWRKNYLLIPAVLFYFAAINTLSRAAILISTLMAVVFFLHTFISFSAKKTRAESVRSGTLSFAILGLVVFCAMVFMPSNMQKEVDTINTHAVLDRVTGKGQYHVRVATELWKDHVLFGCGGWGYRHLCLSKMTEDELKQLQVIGGINVHNDYLQLLAEHGLVGFGAIVAIVVMLLAPVFSTWSRLVKALRFAKRNELPPRPVAIFAFPASAFFMLIGISGTLIHSFGDCPLRSSAVMTLFFVSLAAVEGFLPHLQSKD